MYESKNGYQSPIVEFDWDQVVLYGDFEKYSKANAVTYAWFIWEKGSTEAPIIKWFN